MAHNAPVQTRYQRTDNSWLAIGGKVVAKSSTADAEIQRARFAREIAAYRTFQHDPPPVPVPELIMAGGDRLLVLRWLPGHCLEASHYPTTAPSDAALDTVLRAVGLLNGWRPPADRFDVVLDYPARLRHYRAAAVFTDSDVEALLEQSALCTGELELNHGNPRPDNFLLDDAGQLTGVLDWDRVGWYQPGYDLAVLHTLYCDVPGVRRRVERDVAAAGIEAPFTVNLALVLAGELLRHRERSISTQRYRRLTRLESLWQQTKGRLHQPTGTVTAPVG